MLIEKFTKIKEFAYLPERALDSYRQISGEAKRTQYEIIKIIDEEYRKAASDVEQKKVIYKSGNVVIEDISSADRICIVTEEQSQSDGSAIVLLFVPNRNSNMQPWEMQGAVSESEFNSEFYVEIGNKPGEMLLNYAYWPCYVNDLKILKNEFALYENWSFNEEPDDNDFPILKSYMKYTFAKAWQDKKILISINGRYSVFNTGLVNRSYKYIYVLFEKSTGTKPWKFLMYCIPGIGQGGHLLSDNFRILPKPVRYFSDLSDISYVISEEKTPDEQLPDLQPDHYFIDHPDRLPHDFLLDGCRKNKEIVDFLSQDINNYTKEQKDNYWRQLGEKIALDADVYDDLESAFRSAVRKAVMRVSWNYRTAIPVYFPSYNKMSILLPISFNSQSEAEIALVVEYNRTSQKYTAPTILTLPVAYSNARLVCKPESEWLNQHSFRNVLSEDVDINDD